MKFGLFCLAENYDGDVSAAITKQLALVEAADDLGYDEAWFGEHHSNPFSVIPDPAAMIAYAAARTRSIRLGTAGFLAPFYHPVRLAESIAVLDHLSGGRLDAGFAKGGFAPDTRHFLRSTEDLRGALFETVESVDRLLHGRHIDYDGHFVHIRNNTVLPRPLQRDIPFYIATFSSEETIAFAAQNGYGLMMSQGASLRECVEASRYYRSIAGHDPQIVVLRVLYLADSLEQARREVIPGIDHFVKSMRAVQAEQPPPHFDLENYRTLLAERNAFFDGQKFFDNALLGTPEDCLRTVQTLQKELNHVHLVLKPASSDPSSNRKMLQRFMTEVISQITLKENE